jgi:hypothetical protein
MQKRQMKLSLALLLAVMLASAGEIGRAHV